MSKFSLDVLNRCVYPYLKSNDPDVIVGAVFGEDVALTRVGNDILASHVDPIVGAVNNIGWLAVHVACNDIATSGMPPRWIQTLVLVPHKEDEALLEQIMRDIQRAADENKVSVIGGHSGYSDNLTRPLVAVTALGTFGKRKPILTQGAQVGDHVLITKGIPLEGSAILANDFSKAAIKLGLTKADIEEAKQLMGQVSVIPEAVILGEVGANAMHDVTRGGLLETLLEIADASSVGMNIAYDRIPMPPVALRFSKAFDYDPLKMISSGTLVATLSPEKAESAGRRLDEKGITYADIGEIVSGEGVKIIKGAETIHYNEIHPEQDELARMWTLYATD
jgi:hydrogenase expression/formation protein HypE